MNDYDNISKENRYLGNVSLKYRISRSLTYDLKIGGDLRIANLHIWQGLGTKSGSAREGRYAFSELDRFTYNIDQTVLFRPKKIGQHRYSLLAGVVYANTDSEKRLTEERPTTLPKVS